MRFVSCRVSSISPATSANHPMEILLYILLSSFKYIPLEQPLEENAESLRGVL